MPTTFKKISVSNQPVRTYRQASPVSRPPQTSTVRTYASPRTSYRPAQPSSQYSSYPAKFGAPIVERKIIYNDPNTGARMMKVCTPEGTVKRIECLDEPIQQ
jgi:hypothetical protein